MIYEIGLVSVERTDCRTDTVGGGCLNERTAQRELYE
jgi:hypothetical protein